MKTSGGYLFGDRTLVRGGLHAHTRSLACPVSQLDLDVTNWIQNTPWRINTWVLDVMLRAHLAGRRLGGLEVGRPLSLPPRIDDQVWEHMPKRDKRAYLSRLAEIHAKNATIAGRSQAALDCLAVADELRDEPSIWYPCVRDFRLRVYPEATQGPQPQGSDIAKSLIHFAEGLPLGETGAFWLCIRAANCAGHDKLALSERVSWVYDHRDQIIASSRDPLGSTWWANADEPWCFLATCRELDQMWQTPSIPQFVSYLPVPLDGSCNGLQHLSALVLDSAGALATNCAPGPRQDIYQRIADRVAALVEDDVVAGVAAARTWHGKVMRQTVKRAVMTTPYGVTNRGIRKQLLDDELVPDPEDGSPSEAADYLQDKLVQALSEAVTGAKAVMAWLQSTAAALARAGLPFDWTTPTGSQIRQAYHSVSGVRIKTLCGSLLLCEEQLKAPLSEAKQAAGAAPNFIHSFDAAHLSMTVASGESQGIHAWSMIHDSFGTHAANTALLSTILRQNFVAIYRENWLYRLYGEVRGYAPHVPITEPPTRGTFDIDQVLNAEFFFS